MAGIYTVPLSFTYTNAGGTHDIIYLAPATGHPIKLLGFTLGQSSEAGDAAAEHIRVSVLRLGATVTASSGGSAVTPTPTGDAGAANFTARGGDATVATTSGTTETVAEYGWNLMASPWPEDYREDKGLRAAPRALPGEALVIRGQTTVADDVTMQVTAWVLEE